MRQLFKEFVCFLFENNLHDTAYYVLQGVALIISIFIAVRFGCKIGLVIQKGAISVLAEVAAVYAEMAVLRVIVDIVVPGDIPVMNTYYNNVGRTFVLVPLSAWVLSKILKENFDKISAQIYCDSCKISKIDINFAPACEFEYHPYMTRRAAKLITETRESKGGWNSIEEMIEDDIFTEEQARAIAPYLLFGTTPQEFD